MEQFEPFSRGILSLDLEVGGQDGRVLAFGAVRSDTGRSVVHSKGNLASLVSMA